MRVTSYVEIVLLPDDTLRCPATWDGVACWPSSRPDHVLTQACPSFYEEPELDWVSRKYAISYFAFMYIRHKLFCFHVLVHVHLHSVFFQATAQVLV